MEILGKKDIETTTMANFYSQVSQSSGQRGAYVKMISRAFVLTFVAPEAILLVVS